MNKRGSARGTHDSLSINIKNREKVKQSLELNDDLNSYEEELYYCKSISDIFHSKNIPILHGIEMPNSLQPFTYDNDEIEQMSILNHSSVLKSLNSIPRVITDKENPVTNNTRRTGKASKADDFDFKFKRAMVVMNYAKKVVDSGRILFEAALLFDEIKQYELAIKCYEKAVIKINSGDVVDTYDLPITVEYNRKIERMSKFQLVTFLKRRSELREQLIFAEDERQRLRGIVANCQLLRLHLKRNNFPGAHNAMYHALRDCKTQVERSEILWYCHSVLKCYVNSEKFEIPLDQQILRGTAGTVAETHIDVLHELLEENATNAGLYEFLGLRYAEKQEFEKSSFYYVKARQLHDNPAYISRKEGLQEKIKLTKEFKFVGLDTIENIDNFHKKQTIKDYNFVPENKAIKDYSTFHGVHNHGDTLVIVPPPGGWE